MRRVTSRRHSWSVGLASEAGDQARVAQRPSKPWRDILLLAASVVLTLLAAEGLVRVFVPVRSVGRAWTVYDSAYGLRLKRDFSGTQITPEYTMKLSTNSLGFRGPEPPTFPRRGVLFLGDSFTVGQGVNDGEEFPALVGSALKKDGFENIPIVNAGRGNSGQGHWLKFLRREGPRFSPRLVVLEIYANDFDDNVREQLFTLGANGRLAEHNAPSPGIGRVIQGFAEAIPGVGGSYLFGLFRQAYFGLSERRSRRPQTAPAAPWGTGPADSLTMALLSNVLQVCRDHGWPAIVVSVALEGKRRTATDSLFSAWAVPVAHIPTKEERPELYYPVDGHWNRAGHQFVAREVLEVMATSGLLEVLGKERPDGSIHNDGR